MLANLNLDGPVLWFQNSNKMRRVFNNLYEEWVIMDLYIYLSHEHATKMSTTV